LGRSILHYGSNEPIALPSKCLYKNGIFRGFAQRITQSLDSSIQTMIEIDEGVCRPELSAQLFSGNHLPWSFDQGSQ
jgi:hypothetical protein